MNTYYIIQYNDIQFQVLITYDFGKKTYIILNSEGKTCVSAQVSSIHETELYLSMILNTQMDRGADTVSMVKALLRFLLQNETFTKISFVDTSTFNCELFDTSESNGNDMSITIPISLTHHNISIYGKTWYERHFNAYVSDASVRELMNASVSKLQSNICANETFIRIQKAIQHTIESTESTQFKTVLYYVLELLDEYLASSEPWMNFFTNIFGASGNVANIYGSNFSCSLYYTFDAAVNELFSIPFECESLQMEITKETIMTFSELNNVYENKTPLHKKMWGGTYKLRKLSKHISMPNYYTNLSLKRKRRRI